MDERVEEEIPCLGKNLLVLLDAGRRRRGSERMSKIVHDFVWKGFALISHCLGKIGNDIHFIPISN